MSTVSSALQQGPNSRGTFLASQRWQRAEWLRLAQELRDATLKLSPEALGDKGAAAGEREEAGFVGVAKHGYGCRVVQRVMEHCALPGWKDQICRQARPHLSSCVRPTWMLSPC